MSLAQTPEDQPQNLLLTLFWLNKHVPSLSQKSSWVCPTFRPGRHPNAFLNIIPHTFLERDVNGRMLLRQGVKVQVPSGQWQVVWSCASYLPSLSLNFLLLKWRNSVGFMNCQQDKKKCEHLEHPFPLNHMRQVPRSTYPPDSSVCICAPFVHSGDPALIHDLSMEEALRMDGRENKAKPGCLAKSSKSKSEKLGPRLKNNIENRGWMWKI